MVKFSDSANRKAVTDMENANIEYLMNIFRELTTEMPDELIYRENGDIIELRSSQCFEAA